MGDQEGFREPLRRGLHPLSGLSGKMRLWYMRLPSGVFHAPERYSHAVPDSPAVDGICCAAVSLELHVALHADAFACLH